MSENARPAVWGEAHKMPPLMCPECAADLSYGEGHSTGYRYDNVVIVDCCPVCDSVTLVLLDEDSHIKQVYGLSDDQFRAHIEGTPIPYNREESVYMRHRIRRGEIPYENK